MGLTATRIVKTVNQYYCRRTFYSERLPSRLKSLSLRDVHPSSRTKVSSAFIKIPMKEIIAVNYGCGDDDGEGDKKFCGFRFLWFISR